MGRRLSAPSEDEDEDGEDKQTNPEEKKPISRGHKKRSKVKTAAQADTPQLFSSEDATAGDAHQLGSSKTLVEEAFQTYSRSVQSKSQRSSLSNFRLSLQNLVPAFVSLFKDRYDGPDQDLHLEFVMKWLNEFVRELLLDQTGAKETIHLDEDGPPTVSYEGGESEGDANIGLTYKEFLSLTSQFTRVVYWLEDIRRAFQRLDHDKKGFIIYSDLLHPSLWPNMGGGSSSGSRGELWKLENMEGEIELDEEQAKEMIKEGDRNGDGFLDYVEFVELMRLVHLDMKFHLGRKRKR